jgi:uncharacterized protein YndB with AHSA1/START domain
VTEISAAGVIGAPAAPIFDHLADLRTHWELAGGRVTLLEPDADAARGGRVRMRGPLGVGREATTEVLRAERPTLLEGRARVGRATEASIRWRLEAISAAETRVELTARVVATSAWDRMLLAAGGRLWLRHMFHSVMDRLATVAPSLRVSGPQAPAPAMALEGSR